MFFSLLSQRMNVTGLNVMRFKTKDIKNNRFFSLHRETIVDLIDISIVAYERIIIIISEQMNDPL